MRIPLGLTLLLLMHPASKCPTDPGAIDGGPTGGIPTPPTTGSMQFAVNALPSMPASITITGPAGYSRVVTTSQTIESLVFGQYTLDAAPAVLSGTTYLPSPASQLVDISASSVQVQASVYYCPGDCPWTGKAPLPTPRYFLAAGVANGVLYAVGGGDGVVKFNAVEAFDPATDSWTARASLPTARDNLGVGVVNGVVYAVGGYATNLDLGVVESYDPAGDVWTTRAPMPTPREQFAVGVIGGTMYAIGGYDASGKLATVEAYDAASDSWSTRAPIPIVNGRMSAAVIRDTLYVLGTYFAVGVGVGQNVLQSYDPATDKWTARSVRSTAISGNAVTMSAINGVLYTVGIDMLGTGVEAYDPTIGTWTRVQPMPTPRVYEAADVVNGTLYVVGGAGGVPGASSAVEAFTP